MPHSSGGGSHGGGFHGGSHYSGGNSTQPATRTSKSYFPGSMLFFYYDSHHNMRTFYSNKSEIRKNKKISYFVFGFFLIFILTIFSIMIIRNPKKLSTNYNASIVILDTNDVLSDSEEEMLNETFKAFRDNTGITPALYTVSYEEYSGEYSSLERYSYYKYLNLFEDEKHWLIVYSSQSGSIKGNWAFEGMQGDDTDNIITSKFAKKLTKDIYNGLNNTDESPAVVINNAFNDVNSTIMKKGLEANPMAFMILLIFSIPLTIIIVASVKNDIIAGKLENDGKGISHESKERVCPYCGTKYYEGFVKRCPKCKSLLTEYQEEGENNEF